MPSLSIVMPVYGVEKYISTAIESVLSQTYQDWELIIVNDGTKDRSREIAQKYKECDSRIHIIDKENGGLSDARNVGLQYACGEYVHFFDSDDYISEDYYSNLIGYITPNKTDILISGYTVEFQDNHNKLISDDIREMKKSEINDFTSKEWLQFIDKYFNYAWNKLFRLDFLKENSLLYKKGLYSIEDAEFMSRVIISAPNIKLCPSVGYHYINRDRISLGRCYKREIVDFNTNKLEIQKIIGHYFINDPYVVDEWIEESRLSIFKFLFNSLFLFSNDMGMVDILSELNYILNVKKLQTTIKIRENKSIFDKILMTFISHKCSLFIYLIYEIKKLIYTYK